MTTIDYRDYEKMSPFEIKDGLIKLAKRSAQKSAHALLNAGRGNPNWIATNAARRLLPVRPVRPDRSPPYDGQSDGRSRRHAATEGIAERLKAWLEKHAEMDRARISCRGWSTTASRRLDLTPTPSCSNWPIRSSATTIPCPTACWSTPNRSRTGT